MNDVIDDLVEDALRELADRTYQRDLWLSAGPPEVSSFIECVSRLWTDAGLGDALDQSDTVYTASIDSELRELRKLLRRIDGTRSPHEILDDPDLEQVRSSARKLLIDLRFFGSLED